MVKKIILILLIALSFIVGNDVFAETITTDEGVKVDSAYYNPSTDGKAIKKTVDTSDTYGPNKALYEKGTANTNNTAGTAGGAGAKGGEAGTATPANGCACGDCEFGCKGDLDKAIEKNAADDAAKAGDAGGGGGPDDITSKDFEIDTGLFTIGGKSLKGDSAKETVNNILGNIIQKLMIALGVIALFVMTVGAGYMVLYHGEDEFLTKGKNIFIGGITALIVALSSYYLVNIVGYILYS